MYNLKEKKLTLFVGAGVGGFVGKFVGAGVGGFVGAGVGCVIKSSVQ